MKRLFLSLVVLMAVSMTVSVNAQDKKRGNGHDSRMEKELNLTDAQKKDMKTLRTEFGSKMKELRDNKSLGKEDRQAKSKELREQHMADVNKVLTPDQQAKMKEWKDKRGDRMQRDGKRGKDMSMRDKKEMPKHGDRMKDLNLTDEQKQKIKALNEDFKIKSRDLSKQHRESLDKVYTPEQKSKLDQMRKSFNKDHKFSHKGKRGDFKLDEAGRAKLKDLRENFLKEKKAVELSRIAPDAQKQKIKELTTKYKEERMQVIKDSRKAKNSKPV